MFCCLGPLPLFYLMSHTCGVALALMWALVRIREEVCAFLKCGISVALRPGVPIDAHAATCLSRADCCRLRQEGAFTCTWPPLHRPPSQSRSTHNSRQSASLLQWGPYLAHRRFNYTLGRLVELRTLGRRHIRPPARHTCAPRRKRQRRSSPQRFQTSSSDPQLYKPKRRPLPSPGWPLRRQHWPSSQAPPQLDPTRRR